ncbi:MAG: radical SAM protein [Phycisphaerae bacterium]|nr:radical SAM protein [Phycisphaerae bacterium]
MKDLYNRTIDYLRVSVTDRCNLRCSYCMPETAIGSKGHDDILSYEEICDFAKVAVSMGIKKIRITGGEPLVRKNILHLVELLNSLNGLDEVCMTTNGTLLPLYANALKAAGLKRINISLDTVSPEHFSTITGGGKLEDVLSGIQAAQDAGLDPIKLNCVVENSSQDPNAREVAAFAKQKGLQVRFIKKMNIQTGSFSIVDGGNGGNCAICNRLRLSSDGYLRPCLFSDIKYNIRKLDYCKAIQLAIGSKPEQGTYSRDNQMYRIGG